MDSFWWAYHAVQRNWQRSATQRGQKNNIKASGLFMLVWVGGQAGMGRCQGCCLKVPGRAAGSFRKLPSFRRLKLEIQVGELVGKERKF